MAQLLGWSFKRHFKVDWYVDYLRIQNHLTEMPGTNDAQLQSQNQ